jgi:hypothetical protein
MVSKQCIRENYQFNVKDCAGWVKCKVLLGDATFLPLNYIIVFRVKKRDVQLKTTESGLQRRLYLC